MASIRSGASDYQTGARLNAYASCMAVNINMLVGWCSVSAGIVAGAVSGLHFWRDDWLGGYGAWRRRMVRLAHVAFFGLGILNLLFSLSVHALGLQEGVRSLQVASALLAAGAVTMPITCYLSAWRMSMRSLFAVPVLCVFVGVLLFIRTSVLR